MDVDWLIAERPGRVKTLKQHPRKNKTAINIEYMKASIRARVEHPFRIIVAMVIIFLFIYSKITPHNEWQLIKNNNTAAALAFSGTLLGYVIPLSSAAINAVSIPDYFAWGGIALVIQLLVFAGVRLGNGANLLI